MQFRAAKLEELSLNITPLIDVVFLLLIFFMVSTQFTQETEMAIKLPSAQGETVEKDKDTIEIQIDRQGHYAINGKRLSAEAAQNLKHTIQTYLTDPKQQAFIIHADGQTAHQSVVKVIEIAKEIGFTGVGIRTEENNKHE